ncbi:hypothetical protein FRC01_014911, partial [Tulasnella sp. 417]
LLETIQQPLVRSLSMSLDLNPNTDSSHLLRPIIKSAYALFPTIFDAQYKIVITVFSADCLHWTCEPSGTNLGGRGFEITERDKSASETLKDILDETPPNRFTPESIKIDFNYPFDLDLSSFLPTLDGVDRICDIVASGCDLDPLFTYMSRATTCEKYGFPKLENLRIGDDDYDPSHLLSMIKARYGLEEGLAGDASKGQRDLPPPLKWVSINSVPTTPGIFQLIEDIIGSSNSALIHTASDMNPATSAVVESAINLLLQSIYDENKNAMGSLRHIQSRAGEAEIDTGTLSQVDNYAAAIKSTLDTVQGRLRAKISALHTAHNKMISFHKLPIEIFVQIITGALAPFQTRHWSGQTHLRRLVTLCTVCKRWTEVISRTASLWATIDIRDPTAITSTAISRSAKHTLNIIGAPSSSPIMFWPDAPDGWEQFVNTAIAVSTRWRSIQLVVASEESALAILSAHAPRLERLEIKSTTECRFDVWRGDNTFQAIGPQLRRLGLHGLAIPWHASSCALGKLRSISISGLEVFVPSCEEILGMLGGCPELVDVVLSLGRTADAETSLRRPAFTLAQLDSMSFSRLSPSWTLALLETINTPSVRYLDLDLDFSDSEHLFPSAIKRVGTLCSSVIDTQYQLEIHFVTPYIQWICHPVDKRSNWRYIDLKARNYPARALETLWAELGTSRFAPEFVLISLVKLDHLETSLLLPKLDTINAIHSFSVHSGDANPLFTYMSRPTTNNEWGLPKLEDLTLYDCNYDPEQLLDMVWARYEGESPEGGDTSGTGRSRPPRFKELNIHHVPGEADEDTLDVVADTVGRDCFTLYEDVDW